MPVKIPVAYVPRARIDYDAEQRQILGYPLVLSDGFRVPPLTAARLLALELVTSDFFLHPESCDMLDAAAALVLVSCDRNLVEELTADAPSASAAERTAQVEAPPPPPGMRAFPDFYAAAAAFMKAHGDALVADYARIVDWILVVPNYGFDMLPRHGDAPCKPCWYDGEFVGGILAPAAKILAIPFDRLVWETPLCTVGHVIAQQSAAFGVKGVERPPDKTALKAMMKAAAERESRGELHPWQYADPMAYGLTDTQAQANPALIELFSRMRAEFERNGRRPLDPADFCPHAGQAAGQALHEDSPLSSACGHVAGASRAADGSDDASQDSECCPPLCVSVPLDGRDVRSTIAVQGLPCGPHGPSAHIVI